MDAGMGNMSLLDHLDERTTLEQIWQIALPQLIGGEEKVIIPTGISSLIGTSGMAVIAQRFEYVYCSLISQQLTNTS